MANSSESVITHEWHQALSALAINPATEAAEATLQGLLARYTEPQRHWHTAQHIAGMLECLRGWCGTVPPALVLATLYHDAVYQPGAADNEALSAQVAQKELTVLGVPSGVIEKVRTLIEATRTHSRPHSDAEALFLDADMAILGSTEARYQAYCTAIRREHATTSPRAYRLGRIRFLLGMLTRARLFYSPAGRALTSRARGNMRRELWQLLWQKPDLAPRGRAKIANIRLSTGTVCQLVEPRHPKVPGYQVLSCTPSHGEPTARELEELASLAVRHARLKAKEVLGSEDSYLLLQSGPAVRRKGHYHCHLIPLSSVAGKARVYLYLGLKNCVRALRRATRHGRESSFSSPH
jgi:predicted metal-dependent HD superfamily phosphohydrolase